MKIVREAFELDDPRVVRLKALAENLRRLRRQYPGVTGSLKKQLMRYAAQAEQLAYEISHKVVEA